MCPALGALLRGQSGVLANAPCDVEPVQAHGESLVKALVQRGFHICDARLFSGLTSTRMLCIKACGHINVHCSWKNDQ